MGMVLFGSVLVPVPGLVICAIMVLLGFLAFMYVLEMVMSFETELCVRHARAMVAESLEEGQRIGLCEMAAQDRQE